MSEHRPTPADALQVQTRGSNAYWAVWAALAAFGTYFAMYGFRKPFTAAGFKEEFWGMDFKTIVVIAQVLGYTLSKFVGIKVIAEMPPNSRAACLLLLIGIAQAALTVFGLVPRPWNAVCLFFNGLPLGMVFGLVMGFLEGRRVTEFLAAGLCASFIIADGATKSLGKALLNAGISEDWMPAVAGAICVIPLVVGVWMLRLLPKPSEADEAARAPRYTMTKSERWQLFNRYAFGLVPLILMYLALTIVRSLRADFQPEIWKSLGVDAKPEDFAITESVIAGVVLAANALIILVRSNRAAFFTSLGICLLGFGILGSVVLARSSGSISPFSYMVLMGLGMYLPYVVTHTTIFERMLAMTREKGNLGFLMYLADAYGYLGYVAVLFGKNFAQGPEQPDTDVLSFIETTIVVMLFACTASILLAWVFFWRRTDRAAMENGSGA